MLVALGPAASNLAVRHLAVRRRPGSVLQPSRWPERKSLPISLLDYWLIFPSVCFAFVSSLLSLREFPGAAGQLTSEQFTHLCDVPIGHLGFINRCP
jgi:hypothetical protein